MTQQQKVPEQTELNDEQVADYLKSHPDFFNQFSELLTDIEVPSPSGGVVSLTVRQMAVLREKNEKLHGQLDSLLQIARENDALFGQMQRLTTDLLDARGVEDVFASLDDSLKESFGADFFTVRIITDDETDFPISQVILEKDSPNYEHFKHLFKSEKIKCGHPTHAQALALFDDKADDVQSTAFIPFKIQKQDGLLAIGSRDEKHFHPSMGTLFLAHLGELVAKRIASFTEL